jgi:hypothetical protein
LRALRQLSPPEQEAYPCRFLAYDHPDVNRTTQPWKSTTQGQAYFVAREGYSTPGNDKGLTDVLQLSGTTLVLSPNWKMEADKIKSQFSPTETSSIHARFFSMYLFAVWRKAISKRQKSSKIIL